MIRAKAVIPDQYWILREQDRKIGNIEAKGEGYVVSIGGQRTHFTNLDTLIKRVPVLFDVQLASPSDENHYEVHGYPTDGPAYNPVFDVQHQLPLWTDNPRSRSWRAAGWYRVKQHRHWCILQCPKLIVLQRYQYQGPFYSLEEAQTA